MEVTTWEDPMTETIYVKFVTREGPKRGVVVCFTYENVLSAMMSVAERMSYPIIHLPSPYTKGDLVDPIDLEEKYHL